MIELKNINFSYGNQQILDDFNLYVKDGECVNLSGVSGSGKTTIIRLVLGLEKPQSGIVTAPKKISCVFQEDRLVENINVINNIRLPLKSHQYPLADELLKRLNLSGIAKKRVDELSGGMKRRIAIIRAIAYGGDALILDEAFNGIDYENKIIIADIIKQEFLDKGKPVIMITHIKEDAEFLTARTINIKGDS